MKALVVVVVTVAVLVDGLPDFKDFFVVVLGVCVAAGDCICCVVVPVFQSESLLGVKDGC